MDRFLYVVWSNPRDPDRESEFHDWFNNTHIPDILSGSPGFIKATRYESCDVASTPAKFLTVLEIESDDITQTMSRHRENMANIRDRGRSGPAERVAGQLYKQIAQINK